MNFNSNNFSAPPPPIPQPDRRTTFTPNGAGGGNRHVTWGAGSVTMEHKFNSNVTGSATVAGSYTHNNHTGRSKGHFNGASVGATINF